MLYEMHNMLQTTLMLSRIAAMLWNHTRQFLLTKEFHGQKILPYVLPTRAAIQSGACA